MTAKQFVKAKYPNARSEHHVTRGSESYYLIRNGSDAFLQKAAEWTDPENKRNPTTILEHVETGIPGLRENVGEFAEYLFFYAVYSLLTMMK